MPSQARITLLGSADILWDIADIDTLAGPQLQNSAGAQLVLPTRGLWLFESRVSTDAQAVVPAGIMADVVVIRGGVTMALTQQWLTDCESMYCRGLIETFADGDQLRVRAAGAAGVPAGTNLFSTLCAVFLGNR